MERLQSASSAAEVILESPHRVSKCQTCGSDLSVKSSPNSRKAVCGECGFNFSATFMSQSTIRPLLKAATKGNKPESCPDCKGAISLTMFGSTLVIDCNNCQNNLKLSQ